MATRTLNVQITCDSRGFARATRDIERDTGRLSKAFDRFGKSASGSADATEGLRLSVGAFGGSASRMLPVLAAATPAMVALGGAATAVAGSLTAAAAGAGALGTGLGASLAPVLVVGKQVTSRFEEIKKAYDAVQTAQREGTEAAKKNAEQALADLSKSERAFVDTMGRLQGLQERVLGGASDRIFTALSGAITRLVPVVETLERPFDRLGDAIARVIRKASQSLSGQEWKGALKAFIDSATGLVGPVSRIFGSIASIMRDVALASLPILRSGFRDLADWFAQLDETATRGAIRDVVRELVGHTKSWWNLTREVGELIFNIFNGGADAGKSLVDSLTEIVSQWNAFLSTDKGQREMRRFFRDAVKATEDLFVILGALAGAIFKVSDLIIRFNNGLQDADRWMARAQDTINRVADMLWDRLIKALGDAARWFGRLLGKIGEFVADAPKLGTAIIRGLVKALGGLGPSIKDAVISGVKSGIRAATGVVGDVIGALNPFGDGIGRLSKSIGDGVGQSFDIPGLGGRGGLMGADPDLAPIAGLGARFGSRVTSGLRVGATTLTGNQSYHATGDAVDMTPVRRAAVAIHNVFGSRLRELITPWPELGIKDGRPFRYSSAIQAQHSGSNAHIHAAFTGPFGDGIGQAASAARAGGFRGRDLVTAVAIAGPESRYRNNARLVTGREDSRGMWQINTYAHPWAAKLDLSNPNVAARAAFRVWREAGGFGPWTAFSSGSYRSYMDRARAAVGGLGGGRAAGGGGGGGGPAPEPRFGPNARMGIPGLLAQNEVFEAKARARDSLPMLIKALETERALKQRQLRKVRRRLRKRLPRDVRRQLLATEAQLIAEIKELGDEITEFGSDALLGGATTISRAEELEAGVDTSVVTDPGGGVTATGDDGSSALASIMAEVAANQRRLIALAEQQGPAVVGAVVAAVNGSIGGKVGLGFQGIRSSAGSVAGL
jgi:hypothetical protein